MHVRPRNTRAEMYAGRVVCCPLVSHVEYDSRAVLRLEKRWDRQTDVRQTNAFRLPIDESSVIAQTYHVSTLVTFIRLGL